MTVSDPSSCPSSGSSSGSSWRAWTSGGAARFDATLEAMIAGKPGATPERLVSAMRHAVLAGGKRLRPYLVLESAALCGVDAGAATRVAAALEFIHCYSLVHDDLPAMDNDDMRRGKPTVHRAYDEATAILAGDGLLTEAFGLVADADRLSADARLRVISALVLAAGGRGMVGGQMLDLAAEGRFGQGAPVPLDAAAIITLQGMKTGALIRFGALAGALMADAPPAGALDALGRYGTALGLAFQIRDDLIDVESDAATAGKATGKDGAAGKGTFVTLLGLDGARARLAAAGDEGLAALQPFGNAADGLREIIAFNASRMS